MGCRYEATVVGFQFDAPVAYHIKEATCTTEGYDVVHYYTGDPEAGEDTMEEVSWCCPYGEGSYNPEAPCASEEDTSGQEPVYETSMRVPVPEAPYGLVMEADPRNVVRVSCEDGKPASRFMFLLPALQDNAMGAFFKVRDALSPGGEARAVNAPDSCCIRPKQLAMPSTSGRTFWSSGSPTSPLSSR